jgi:predicted nucleotidyltransferase
MEAVTDLNKEKIQEYLKNHKTKLHSLGVESLHLFGSVARREANNLSE